MLYVLNKRKTLTYIPQPIIIFCIFVSINCKFFLFLLRLFKLTITALQLNNQPIITIKTLCKIWRHGSFSSDRPTSNRVLRSRTARPFKSGFRPRNTSFYPNARVPCKNFQFVFHPQSKRSFVRCSDCEDPRSPRQVQYSETISFILFVSFLFLTVSVI